MLLGAVSLVLAVLGFVDVVFSPGGVTTFRWVLLALVAGFALATVATRDRRPKRAVALADAGGLTALALALTLVVDQVFGSSPLFGPGAGTGWELFLYACGFGLCAFSAVDRAPGPGWIGVAVLLATTIAAAGGKATLVGWPLVLAVGAGGLLVIGLRPSRPLPPDAFARRGPRLRDQERTVSDLHEALRPRRRRRPGAPPREGARAGQAAGARARRAAARRRLVRRGRAAGQLGGRRARRRRRRHRHGDASTAGPSR